MRADRLLQLATLLRLHGRLSAGELSRRLEVTPRTIARDIEALSAAGVPVYAERGRSGGYALLPGFRPATESLAADEAGALFVAGGAQVAADLGLGDEFGRALRKLASGMPPAHIDRVGGLLDRLVIDPEGWGEDAGETPAALEVAFEGVQAQRQLGVTYRARGAARGTQRRLDPWGLVLAAGTWYLIAASPAEQGSRGHGEVRRGRLVVRTYRVDRIEGAELLDEPGERPERLDLTALWQELRARWRARPACPIVLSVTRAQVDLVRRTLALVAVSRPCVNDTGGDRVELSLEVSTLRGAVGVLLGFGAWLEVLAPPELRELMGEIAGEVGELYAVPG